MRNWHELFFGTKFCDDLLAEKSDKIATRSVTVCSVLVLPKYRHGTTSAVRLNICLFMLFRKFPSSAASNVDLRRFE